MEIISEQQLTLEMNKISVAVINTVSEKVLKQLQDDIRRDVYEHDYFPNKYYVMGMGIPTFDFLRAWKWDKIKTDIVSITKELFYDFMSMSLDVNNYIHGSPKYGDRREELAEDLNVSGIAINSDFPVKERAPYWANFLWEMLEERQIETWFEEELAGYGFIKS